MDTSSSATTPLLRRRRTATGPDGGEVAPTIVTGMKCPENYRGYSNMDEILASFGNWHPFYRLNVALSTVVYLICSVSLSSVYLLRSVLQTSLGSPNSYCCCVNDKHALHQEALNKTIPSFVDQKDIDRDAAIFDNAANWGYLAGLALLFLCNRVGRRIVLGCSVVLFGVALGTFYLVAEKSVYQTRMAIFMATIAMTQVDLGLMMHMLEWLPSAARPLGTFVQLLCFYFADVLSAVLIRYSHGFAPYLILVNASVVVAAGLLVIIFFRESPYYYLMKHDIDSLHDTVLRIALYRGKEKTSELEQDVDDAIDDVAFEVYEGNDTVVDAMIRMFKQRKLVVTLVVMVLIVTAQKEVERTIDTNELGHFRWGIFESPVRYSTYNGLGLVLGFLITGRRRALPITLSFAVTGLLLILAYVIQGDDTYDTCTEAFVMADVAGYFVLVLRVMAEVVKRSSDVATALYVNEYFPSAVRPVCIALIYMATSSLLPIVKAFTNVLGSHGPSVAKMLPIVYCMVMSLATLLLHKEPFPMTVWYADLDRLDKHKERESYAKPLLSGKSKSRKTEIVDSD